MAPGHGRATGLGLLLLSHFGRFRPLAASLVALAARCHRGPISSGIAGLSLVRPTRELFVVFALDRSASIGDQGNRAIDDFLTKAADHAGSNRFAVLPFASEPGIVRSGNEAIAAIKAAKVAAPKKEPAAGTAAAEPEDARGLDRKGTDVAAASRWLLRRFLRFTCRVSCFCQMAIPPMATHSRWRRRSTARLMYSHPPCRSVMTPKSNSPP